MLLYAKIVVG